MIYGVVYSIVAVEITQLHYLHLFNHKRCVAKRGFQI